ncbi:hypothetical protein HDU67_006181, partial [Dinochytrium kinnereticum]
HPQDHWHRGPLRTLNHLLPPPPCPFHMGCLAPKRLGRERSPRRWCCRRLRGGRWRAGCRFGSRSM